jgi:hypothetical protein
MPDQQPFSMPNRLSTIQRLVPHRQINQPGNDPIRIQRHVRALRDWQRLTSSAFSMGVVVSDKGFSLSGVEPRSLRRIADSGRTSTRWGCPVCGSWIAGPPRDNLIRVRAGTLADTSWLRPIRHMWTSRRQPWTRSPREIRFWRSTPRKPLVDPARSSTRLD